MALEGITTVIAKESYLDVGQFKIILRKDNEYSTTDYLDLKRAPRVNYQTEAAFPTRVILGHTIPTSQERGRGGGRPSRNSDTVVYRDIYSSARSPGTKNYNLSSWRAPDQW